MKFRILACFMAVCCLLAGCEKVEEDAVSDPVEETTAETFAETEYVGVFDPDGDLNSKQSTSSNRSVIPDDAMQRLQAALDIEPITIPAEEWTVETLCRVVYINGTPISVPCTLNDLGEGFAIQESEEYPLSINESTHRASAPIEYYGNYIGTAVVKDCENEEAFFDSPIYRLFFSFETGSSMEAIPLSLNGLGFHATREAQAERLFFMNLYDEDEETNYFKYTKKIDDIEIKCTYIDDSLYSVTIGFQDEE